MRNAPVAKGPACGYQIRSTPDFKIVGFVGEPPAELWRAVCCPKDSGLMLAIKTSVTAGVFAFPAGGLCGPKVPLGS